MSQFGQPQVVPQATGAEIFEMEEDSRVAYLRALGAKNVDPPRPRSSHLKIIATGIVHPWNELLALQTELVLNCDAYGNTDPSAWMPTVNPQEYDPSEQAALVAKAQATVLQQAVNLTSTHRAVEAVNPATPLPMEYPAGIIAAADVDKLNAMLES